MSVPSSEAAPSALVRGRDARAGAAWVRWTVTSLALAFLGIFIVLPLIVVFAEAFSKGFEAYLAALSDADTLSAIHLTLLTALISVALNLAFGLAAGWAIAKFEFPGKGLLITLI